MGGHGFSRAVGGNNEGALAPQVHSPASRTPFYHTLHAFWFTIGASALQ